MKKILTILIFLLSAKIMKSQCSANFTFSLGLNGDVTFTDTSIGTNTNTTYQWNFGEPNSGFNTSGLQNPNHIYGSNGTYTVSLTIVVNGTLGGCTSSVTQNFNVSSSPCNLPINATWTFTNSYGVCGFTSTSTGTTGGASYSWDFGDGATAATPNAAHTYTSNASFLAKLKVVDGGCVDSLENWMYICSVQPSFTYAAGLNGAVSFSSTSTGTPGGVTYNWMFGDGTNAPGPTVTHTYNSNGTYNVTLWLNNMNFTTCPTNTSQSNVVVSNATCNLFAGMSYTDTNNGLVNFESTATGTTIGTLYNWNFGDGATGTGSTTSHTYLNGGNHNVWFKVTNTPTCMDSILTVVNVTSTPCSANSNFSLTYSGTPLLWYATPSYPYNLSCGSWNWGDGTNTGTACVIYGSHTYSAAGVYTICFGAVASCGSSSTCAANNIYKMAEMPAMITLSVVPHSQFITTVKNIDQENAIVGIYPNPNIGILKISMLGIKGAGRNVKVSFYDVVGKQVYTGEVEVVNGQVDARLNVSHLDNGAYFMKIATENQNYSLKMILHK